MSFSELGLSEKVLEAVAAAGYTSPTPIQAQAIPPALARRDVLGIAQTGTGKTAAFTLPMLNRLETGRARARMPRTLILEPTRELAAQVEDSFVKLGAQHKLSVALLIGGVSFADQDAKITRGADVLIATPGRLLDHFERGKLLLTGIEVLVIDEADRMLDMGFIPDIERICKMVPFTRQTLFFSATMPPEIQRLTEAFLSNPVKVEVARPASTASTITQRLVASGAESYTKRDVLRRLIRNAENLQNAIVFCNRKSDVAILYRSLEKHGFNVVALHGDMDQRSRMQALDSFRNGTATLLVASDVAARGLDIPEVSHVFNFDVPFHAEDYVHRIGRTGRAGRTGSAISLVTTRDAKALAAIEQLTGKAIEWEGPTIDALVAENPELDRAEPSRDRGRGPRGEGRDRDGRGRDGRSRERRDAPPDRRPARAEEARPTRAPSAQREAPPARREPVRYEPVRAGERPVQYRARHDDDLPVVGFGDHIPAFLLQKVVLPPPSDNLEPEEFDEIELTVVEEPETQEASEASEGRDGGRRRKRRKRSIDIATPADIATDAVPEAPVEAIAAQPQAVTEAQAETEAVVEEAASADAAPDVAEEAPAKPARRSRRKAAPALEPAPEAEAAPVEAAPAEEAAAEEAPAEEAAAKPVKRRTRKATVESDGGEAAGETEAAPAKPARARKPKAAVATDAEAGPEAAVAEKPARKPATRRKAAATDATAEEKSAAASGTVAKASTRKPRKKAGDAEAAASGEAGGADGADQVQSAEDLSLAGASDA